MNRPESKPRMRPFTRPMRLAKSVGLLKNSKVNAGLALVGPAFINSTFNKAVNKLGVNNLHRTHLNSLRQLIKNRMKNHTSQTATNSVIKNAAVRSMTNYMAQRIGYKNNANSQQLHNLLMKIESRRRNMNATPSGPGGNAQRRAIGEEIGNLIGSLILKWNSGRQKGDPNRKGYGPGFITGILTPLIGKNAANRIVGTMPMINSARAWYQNLRKISRDPNAKWGNTLKHVLDPEKLAREKAARPPNVFVNAPRNFPRN